MFIKQGKDLKKKLKEVYEIVTDPRLGTEGRDVCETIFIAMLIFASVAAILTVQNIRVHSHVMAYATTLLAVGCAFNAVVAKVWKKENLAKMITVVLVALLLSGFAVFAGNEGFAILWILLVPVAAVNLLGVEMGIGISTYFLVFLFILFYSSANSVIVGKYTDATMSRFPILYLADYSLSLYLSLQKEYYLRITQIHSQCDDLTGLYNRSMFAVKKKEMLKENLVVIMFDLNGLKTLNDTFGHDAGDVLITSFAKLSKSVFTKYGYVFRMGGDEFLVLANMTDEEIELQMKEHENKCNDWEYKDRKGLSYSAGIARSEEHWDLNIEGLMKVADESMYRAKAAYYTVHDRRRKRDA